MLTRRGLLIGIAAAAGALALGAGIVYRRSQDAAAGAGPDASTLLALALPDPSGKEIGLAQWRGRVLVVNFWATWCTPCREEMPEFIRAQTEFGARGLQFVGIGIDEAAKIERFAAEIGLNYPTLVGGYGAMELSRSLGNNVMALPFTVVVDRGGRIAHTQLGPLKSDQLRAIIGKLV